jgi:hypothetical protein
VGVISFSTAGGGGGNGTALGCSNTPYSKSLPWTISDAAIQAGGSSNSLSSPTGNLFTAQGVAFSTDNPGSLSSAVTTKGSYSLQAGYILQIKSVGASSFYVPINVPANWPAGQPYTVFSEGGQPIVTVTGIQSTTNQDCVGWAIQAAQIFAPSSGTASTNAIIAGVTSSDASQSFASPGTGGNISLSGVTWYATIGTKQAGSAFGFGHNVYSTSAASVVNYASGAATVPVGQSVPFQTVLFIFTNNTNFAISLNTDAVNSGLTMTQITNPGLTSATYGWAVSGFNGCNVATQASLTTCMQADFTVSANSYSKNTATEVVFQWVGQTQPGYGIAHATNPAVADEDDVVGSGAFSGIASSFGGMTVPTGGADSGAPTVLFEQGYAVIQYSSTSS